MKTELLHKLLLACGRVYRDGDHFKPILEKETPLSVENDFADIGLIDGRVVIAVCGSNDSMDWSENIFLNFKNELQGQILSWIEINNFSSKRILVTGHSRGAYIAQEIALYLEMVGYNVEAVVTFASPMIRNPMQKVGKYPHYRFVNGRDGVPSTPLLIQRLFSKANWGHNGILIHMNKPIWCWAWMKITGTAQYHSITEYEKAFCKHYKIINTY